MSSIFKIGKSSFSIECFSKFGEEPSVLDGFKTKKSAITKINSLTAEYPHTEFHLIESYKDEIFGKCNDTVMIAVGSTRITSGPLLYV